MSRISESSALPDIQNQQEMINKHQQQEKTETQKFDEKELKSILKNSQNQNLETVSDSTSIRPRRKSVELSKIVSTKSDADFNTSDDNENAKLSYSTTNFTGSNAKNMLQNPLTMQTPVYNEPAPIQLDPSQVFLQLFQPKLSSDLKEKPLLVPENDNIKRSLGLLDYLPCYLIHKIGVIYIGKNQANDERSILLNSYGSVRYKNFLNGLGNLIYLKDMDTRKFYSGGLETDGSLADFTLLWFDGIVQVLFHVATMMFSKDDNFVNKKRHIGNDSAIIVYNESGEEYQFNMIKVCVKFSKNSLKVKIN